MHHKKHKGWAGKIKSTDHTITKKFGKDTLTESNKNIGSNTETSFRPNKFGITNKTCDSF